MIINPYVFGSGPAGDPKWANVALYLPFDGSNGSTTFPDVSSYARSMSVLGAVTISTGDSKFGGSSGLFPANGGLFALDSPSLELGGADFCIECHIKKNNNTVGAILDKRGSGGTGVAPLIIVSQVSGAVSVFASSDGATYGMVISTAASAILAGDPWKHLAVERVGNNFDIYVEGTSAANGTLSGSLNDIANDWMIGIRSPDGAQALDAYVDCMRWTLGDYRYGGSFTPPAAAYPTF